MSSGRLKRPSEYKDEVIGAFYDEARERIAELEQLLERTRQQYYDTDQMLRLRDTECRGLRRAMDEQSSAAAAEINDLESEVTKLRSEASELMAENANHVLAKDHLKQERANLHQKIAWHVENAKQQAEVIREQGAEIERLEAIALSDGGALEFAGKCQ